MKTPEQIRRNRQRLTAIKPKLVRIAFITDEQAKRARVMRSITGKSWEYIAKRLGVPRKALIQRCDRIQARKEGMTAPGWLY